LYPVFQLRARFTLHFHALNHDGESPVAVVAGSNLIAGPEQYIAESKLQMFSPTGRSRMWDADIDGYARGEDVAAIVLKRFSQALAYGKHVECIIWETGRNQDGKAKGITHLCQMQPLKPPLSEERMRRVVLI
jgi:acyl transferase domain-containing protein